MKRLLAGLLGASVSLWALAGCGKAGKDEDEDEAEDGGSDAPPPPAPGTISLDLSVADGTTSAGFAAGDGSATAGAFAAGAAPFAATAATTLGLNHAAASIVVLVVNVNVSLALVVPVGLLKAAATATPKLTAPNTYTYSFDFAASARTWTGNFVAVRGEGGAVGYSMRVTSEPKDASGCCTDFELFNGSTVEGGTTGAWQMFDPTKPTTAAKTFAVVYDYKTDTDKTLTFVVNSDRPATEKFGAGSRVSYRVTGDDVTMVVRDSAENADRTITWDRTTGAGSHTDPQGKKTCWDTKAKSRADLPC